jgi:ribosomal protein S18 acetylase RimI-like enzyme
MVKSKVLKQFRKKTDKADKAIGLLDSINEKETLSFDIQTDDTTHESADMANRQQKVEQLVVEAAASPQQISKEFLQQALELFETNMGEMYRKSSWGFNLETKRAELEHRKARYLLVNRGNNSDNNNNNNNNNNGLVAFSHFRFEMDDEEDPECVVLYVYEIQVAAAYRKQGLGKRLMGILEHIARKNEMDKVMLTVFKANQGAMDFYTQRLGYVVDESSPKYEDYEILSKKLQNI